MYRPLSLVLDDGGAALVVPYFARVGVRALR